MTEPIALQLYTVREQTAADFMGTLRTLAERGYQAVEFAGYGGIPATRLRQELDAFGLKAAGSHVGYKLWDEQLDGTIKDLLTLGCEYAVVPWLEPAMRPTTAAHVGALAEKLTTWGSACRAAGIRLGYHNHDFEFGMVDGVTIYDMLAGQTDVDLQLDVYWAQFAGVDPVGLIERYSGRIPQLHVKELNKDGTGRDAVFGEGVIDWDRVLPVAAKNGTKWYIVEQDTPDDAIEDTVRGLQNVRTKLTELGIG